MEVGKFARAYVAQKKEDYDLYGKDYGDADALDYLECTEVYYNDVVVSLFDIGCCEHGASALWQINTS